MRDKIVKSEAEWRDQLTPEQYRILRRKGTERPFTNDNYPKTAGAFVCAGCGEPLFNSSDKFESGSGWPSFVRPIESEAIGEHDDRSLFTRRTEVVCARCDGHLGHVFTDGPAPTGLRYCINGAALDFKAQDAMPERQDATSENDDS